jgi:hypothetical protein
VEAVDHMVIQKFVLKTSRRVVFLVFGFLHDVRSESTDDVSEITVGPNFTGQKAARLVILIYMTSEDETRNYFRNVVRKLASNIVQKPKNNIHINVKAENEEEPEGSLQR